MFTSICVYMHNIVQCKLGSPNFGSPNTPVIRTRDKKKKKMRFAIYLLIIVNASPICEYNYDVNITYISLLIIFFTIHFSIIILFYFKIVVNTSIINKKWRKLRLHFVDSEAIKINIIPTKFQFKLQYFNWMLTYSFDVMALTK